METLDEARYKVEPEPYGDFVATPAGVRASLDDPERKENPARLSVTSILVRNRNTATEPNFRKSLSKCRILSPKNT